MEPQDTTKIDSWVFQPTMEEGPGKVHSPASAAATVRSSHVETPGVSAGEKAEALPERLGRFKIVGRLGRGGMGVVLEAYDETLDRKVAVKRLHRDAGRSHGRRLLREAQALARLSHPNVVQVYDAGEQDGRLFIAMELVEGQTLWSWQESPRTWFDCLRVYTEAARGLAAAHSQGIVHRDFKPANCIIDGNGHVKVLDFGLARGVDDVDESEELRLPDLDVDPPVFEPEIERVAANTPVAEGDTRAETDDDDATATSSRSLSALSQRLTQTGTMLGTPAYMAPEQAAGKPSDARSDQFSLCVALYEAIHGERPYAGNPGIALLAAEPPPLRTSVGRGAWGAGRGAAPGWLRAILVRGLSARKEDRFPSMSAFIDAIERGRQRRRKVGLGVLGLGLLVGVAALASGRSSVCEGLRDAEMPAWTETQRLAVHDALSSAAGERAEEIWSATERGLDEYARAWSGARARACEATHVDRVASAELLERRSTCLDGRLAWVRATVEQLSDADARVAARAAHAVRSLPSVEPCLDAERLRGMPPLPAELAGAAAQVRSMLARSWAFDATGRADQGLLAAEEAVASADGLGEPAARLQALARSNRGRLYRAVGRLADARRDFEAVVEQAEQSADEALAIDTLLELTGVAFEQADRSASGAWMAVVRGKLRRHASDRPRRKAELHALEGLVALHDEDYEAAVQSLQAAALGFAELDADATIERGQVLVRLGQAHGHLDHGEAAQRAFGDALALAERESLLPLAAQVHHELGRFFDEGGQVELAEASLRRALELRISFDGPDAPITIPTRTLLASLLAQRGDLDAAYGVAQAARQSLGPTVSANRRAQVMTLLASFERMRGDWEAALDHYRRAREAWGTLAKPDEVELAMLDTLAADCLMMLGRHPAAQSGYEGAIQTLKVRVPDDDPRQVYPLFGLAHLLYEQGERAGAVALYRRALAIQSEVSDNPELSAVLRWELGRAVLDQPAIFPDQQSEAVGLVATAREHYQSVGDAAFVAQLDTYVDACGARCQKDADR